MILQFAESISAVTQILHYEEKSLKKRILVLQYRIRLHFTFRFQCIEMGMLTGCVEFGIRISELTSLP